MRAITTFCSAVLLAVVTLVAPPVQAEELTWQPCGTGQQCAWLTVPIDHGNPGLGTIELRIVRILARGPKPQGALVVNPGGPGSSGADFVRLFALSVPDQIREQFDLVGFDPRGVGQSSPIRCLSDANLARLLRTDSTPRTLAQQQRWMRETATFGPGCRADQPALAPYLDTQQTVADMDLLRAALGAERLNFLGYSYGTLLGARFAEAFPDRVGRFVLDGAVDPALDLMETSRGQARGFQRAIRRFADDCARRAECRLGRSSAQVLQRINTLLRNLDSRPIPTSGPTTLVQSEAITGIVTALYSTQTWPVLGQAITQAQAGDGTLLQRLAYLGNDQVGPQEFSSNLVSAFIATTCLDAPPPPGRIGLARAAQRWSANTAVPELSRTLAWGNAPCSNWFRRGAEPSQVTSSTTAPLLIIGTRYDPATPYQWSQVLNRALPTSSLLTYEGDGHTAFASGIDCVDITVTRYLLSGEAQTRTCTR